MKKGSYNPRSKPWFKLVTVSEYMHGFMARLRRHGII